MTSTASGAAASQFGPNVHALLTVMNKQCGLSHGKCVNPHFPDEPRRHGMRFSRQTLEKQG